MDIAVSNTVVMRNSMGQFISAVELAAEHTIARAVRRGAELSIAMAPSGHKVDPRTTKLKASIRSQVLSRTSGRWYADARHALPIETGAVAHPITGRVSFFWEREGRMWTPGDNTIHHPGNAAQPYLRPAYEIVMSEIMEIAAGEYPG